MSFRCLFCRKGPMDGVSVYRVNATGQAGVWACAAHMKQTDATIPEDVKALGDSLRSALRETGG